MMIDGAASIIVDYELVDVGHEIVEATVASTL
jgi:hypothetical protein